MARFCPRMVESAVLLRRWETAAAAVSGASPTPASAVDRERHKRNFGGKCKYFLSRDVSSVGVKPVRVCFGQQTNMVVHDEPILRNTERETRLTKRIAQYVYSGPRRKWPLTTAVL